MPVRSESHGMITLERTSSASGSDSYSESDEWGSIVCDDGSIGWSCSSILPGDFLWPIGQRFSLVLRYHAGVFNVVGAAFATRLGSPMDDLNNVMSSRLDQIKREIWHSGKLRAKSKQNIVMFLQRYHTLMTSLWGSFQLHLGHTAGSDRRTLFGAH
jgi:hypothetical protein